MITRSLTCADDVLRRAAWTTQTGQAWRALTQLTACVVVFGFLYGSAMGTFRAWTGAEQWGLQMLYSAVKVPVLLIATFTVSLPSFFVLNTLLGLRNDFGESLRALIATQAGLAIILASLAPLTMLWYASTDNYARAVPLNALMFAVASFGGQWLLRGYYRSLIARNRHHQWLMWAWIVVYAFIGIQMGWVLRPFVGSPREDVQFFREEMWDNAYVVVASWLFSSG